MIKISTAKLGIIVASVPIVASAVLARDPFRNPSIIAIQSSDPSMFAEQGERSWGMEFDTSFLKFSEGDVKGGTTDKLEFEEYSASLGFFVPVGEVLLITDFGYSANKYAFSDAKPFTKGETYDVGVIASVQISADTTGYVALSGVWAADRAASLMDGFTWGVAVGYEQEVNQNFTCGFGLFYGSELEDSNLFLPYATFDWQFHEDFSLSSHGDLALNYHIGAGDSRVLSLGYAGSGGVFRLKKNAIGEAVNSVVEDDASVVALMYSHTLDSGLTLKAMVGTAFDRKFTYKSDGQELRSFKSDSSLALGLSGSFEF